MHQEEAFLRACGDIWYGVNKDILGKEDPISNTLDVFLPNYRPKFAVELGCANGWRLAKFRERYGCKTLGIDPSRAALEAGDNSLANHSLVLGTALDLPSLVGAGEVDLLIYGYCLAFMSPESYFQILADCDYALADDGLVVIHDGYAGRPLKVHYATIEYRKDGVKQRAEVYRRLIDFKQLWLAHPHYHQVAELVSNAKSEAVTILQKRQEGSFVDYAMPDDAEQKVFSLND